jgi:iron complex outermembrane receptor protein
MHRPRFWMAAAGALLSAGTVSAQTTPTGEGGLEEVVVTGVRQSLENAIETKRDAAAVVDAISAEDVGKFPTENLAESLQRVTGVQISRFRGEGQTVTIRGLPSEFSLVQLNGRTLTSALGASGSSLSRSFDFTILPSEFVSSVEVYKSPTADLEEGGLAGTVIARTLRPLDIGETRLGGSLQMANESNRDEWAPRASSFYSDTFADGKWGIALGVAYTERLTETHEQRITRFRRANESAQGGLDLNGNGIVENGQPNLPNRPANQPPRGPLNNTPYAMLDSSFHTIFREDRKRTTGIATVQFRPNDQWEFVGEGFYGKVDLFSPRYTDLLRVGIGLQSGGPVIPGSIALEQRPGNDSAVGDQGLPVNTVMAGAFNGVDQRADGRTEEREGDLLSTALSGTYTGESFTVTTELGYSVAKQTRSDPLLENMRRATLAYDARTNSEIIGYSFVGADDAARLDPSNFTLLGFNGEWGRKREDEQSDLAVDVKQNFSWWWIDGLQYGGKYTIRENYEDNRRISASVAQLTPLWGGGPAQLFLREVRPSSGEFLDADGGTSGLFHQSWLVNDPFAFIKAYGRRAIEAVSTITNDPTGINDVEENVSALYFRANLGNPSGKLTGNIGVRAVYTEQQSVGVVPDLTAITFDPTQGSVTRVPAGAPVTVDRNYTDILPSLNLKYELTDDIALRFAASRTMSRPSLTQISPSVTASGSTRTLTANNPELDPFRSNNFDLSGEWYFSRGGLLATTLFYKDIVSLVERQQTQLSLTITELGPGGTRTPVTQLWTSSQLGNGKGTAVSGIEFAYQQNFDFLPAPFDGFGVLTNYTYMDTHGGTPLQGASKNNYTASMYYEKGWFGGRVSYTWRDDFYTGIEGNTQDTRIQQDFGTLDANISFNFNDHVSAVIEATNILEEVDQDRFVPIDLVGFYTDNGRRVLVGLRGSF